MVKEVKLTIVLDDDTSVKVDGKVRWSTRKKQVIGTTEGEMGVWFNARPPVEYVNVLKEAMQKPGSKVPEPDDG